MSDKRYRTGSFTCHNIPDYAQTSARPKSQAKVIHDTNPDFWINADTDPDYGCLPDFFQNVVDSFSCRRQSFRQVAYRNKKLRNKKLSYRREAA